MRVERTRRTKRALAALLVLAMVLSFLPGNLLAHAATEEHPGAVTITVVDEDGQPVQGASVAITVDSASNEQNNIDKTGTTDQNGTVEVMSSSAFVADDFTLSATVTADGFEEKTLAETKIQTAEDDFRVELTSTTINDVTIEGKNLTYNGEKQELVSVTQAEGDTVTYEAVDGTSYELNSEGKPVAVNAGTYEIKVTVKRDGKDDLVETVTTVIDPANIEGISIQGKTLPYNKEEQKLVELTGDFQDGDVVTWIVNSESTQSKDVPQRMAVGTYTVQLKVNRGSNYKLVTEEVTTEITKGNLNLEGLTVTGLNGEYTVDEDGTPVAQPAVDVQGYEEHKDDYTLMYQLDDGDQEPDENAWVKDVIKVTDAGSYIVWVKAVKANYNDSEVPVIPAEDAIAPYNVYIAKADQTFDFDEYDAHTSENDRETITLSGSVPYENVTYDFSATDTKALAGGTITYRVECEEGVASIGNDGILTVNYPGDINVFATLSGNNNYNECVIEYYLNVTGEVSAQGDYISFPTQQVDYTLGTSDTISTQQAEKTNDRILGDVTYSMDAVEGVEFNEQSGALTVADYDALAAAIRGADGALNITVTATKAEHDFYGQDTASYTVTVCFEETPTEPYTLPAATGENGWYTTSVVVTPDARYTIAQSASGAFDKNTTFSDQGSAVRYVYLKNAITGGITDQIPVNIKIDTLPSDPSQMKIEIQELTIVEKMGLYFGFFNPSVTIKFIVEDEMETGESGVDHVKWFYTKSEDATSSILAEKSGTLDVAKEDGKYVATLTLPASEAEQYRGHIAFEAYDAAGNPSAKVTEDNVIIVVDTIHPTMDASFRLADENGVYNPVDRNGVKQHYFNGDVAFTFTIKEANFFSEDVEIGVTKDNAAHDVDVEWTVDETDDEVHYGTFTLSGDGDYVVTMSYPEQSGNVMLDNEGNEVELYTSEVITIDTIAPEMTVEYTPADRAVGNTYYYNNDVEVQFTVTEANFYAEDVKVYVTKDGEAFDYGTVHWGTRDANDRTVGTMTLPAPNDHSGDGDYVITVEYLDRSGNEMVKYVSDTHTIDTVLPEINVAYQNRSGVNTLQDREEHDRRYFVDTQTAVVTITEHNFNPEDVNYDIIAQDVTGAKLELDDLVTMSEWKTQGDVHTMTITYPGDANYTFDVAYADLATNEAVDYATDYFTVDKTAPTNLRVEYSTSVLDTVLESVSFGFYNAKMTVTISADDTVSGVHSFLYSYLNAAGVSSVNAQLIDQAIAAANIRYSNNGVTATASFEIPKMLLGSDNQFNGTVEFTATDRSGIESVVHREAKRIVVDNISPTAQVTYNDPVNTEGNIAYYDGNIQATISVREANFYANDVQVTVSKDGGAATAVPTSWTDNSVDTHTGTFTLSGDGDYIVTINYRDKSSNQMETYTSQQMTIDTQIENPTFSINGQTVGENGGAYKDEAEIAFAFDDINFDTQTVQLVRTRYDAVEDVTDEFIKIGNTETGGSGSFSIPAEVGNDGIYTLTVEMTDKALHTTQSQMKFTINRFGSVYEYDDYLMSLIQDGGQYITIQDGETAAITKDLVITEYNADQLLEGSLQILITRDGESVEADYTTNPATIDDATSIGESGWYQYVYTIKASNFSEDGVYKIALSSAYATSDSEENDSTSVPENSMDGSGAQVMDTMTFTVDTTAPEIRNIVNLEKEIINAQAVDVKYTIVDVGGLKSVEVLVNGEVVDNVTQFNDGGFNYNGQFTIQESNSAQTVQLKVTDLAGNVTDTAAEDFNANELFVFHDTVTVSTNVFVRWYANKPLFWGSICGVVVVVGAICGVVATKRKKKVESK